MARADAAALLVLGRVVMVPAVVASGVAVARHSSAQLGRARMDRLKRSASEAGRRGQEEQRYEWKAAEAREHRGNLAVGARRG
jgi:hypothetical protein